MFGAKASAYFMIHELSGHAKIEMIPNATGVLNNLFSEILDNQKNQIARCVHSRNNLRRLSRQKLR